MRRTLRVIAWIATSVVTSVALLFAAFLVWNSRHAHELEASSHVMTTVRGDVEYAVEGNGFPICPFMDRLVATTLPWPVVVPIPQRTKTS